MYRIKEQDLRVGEPLTFDCYDISGILLLKKGIIINSQRQLDALIERGLFASASPSPEKQIEPTHEKKNTPFDTLDGFKNRLKNIYASLGQSQQNDFESRIIKLIQDIQGICEQDANAALGALHLDHTGRYTIIHPLHVALLSELIGKRQALSMEERTLTLAAALTANISIIDLQEELQKQTTPLTPEQQDQIHKHPTHAAEMLRSLGINHDLWLKTVQHHHEKLDGSGYPGALQNEEIPMSVRIISLADCYSAMVTPRVYRNAIMAKDALKDIFLKRGSETDAHLAQVFIKELGIFPPGAWVKLANGEVGIVTHRASKTPIVKSIIGPRGAPLQKCIRRDSANPEFEIREMVQPDRSLPLNIESLWDY